MKSKLNHWCGAIFIALCLLPTSCSKNEPLPDQLTGKLELDVNLFIKENDVPNTLKSATIENFKVEIFLSDGTEPLVTFDRVSEIPEPLELPVGRYFATASFGENLIAFEAPYYFGESEEFIISINETSQVQISCSLANIMVSVIYSDQLKSSFTDYNTIVSNSTGSLTYAKDENRKGFFNSGPLSIESKLDYLSGGTSKVKTLTGEITNPQVGKHYEIQVDASSQVGSTSISVQLNENIEKEVITLTEDGISNGNGDNEIGFGDLLITEIMYNPSALSDNEGEWLEIYNNSDKTIDLKDLILRRGSNNSFHQITSEISLLSGEYVVLEKSSQATESENYVYAGITLPNSGEEIIINTYGTDGTDGMVICSVDYGASGFNTGLSGKSIQLNPTIKDASEARNGSNWCPATLQYSTGDLGTPGAENPSCN